MAMQEKPDTPVQNSEPAVTKPVKHLELKAAACSSSPRC